MPRNLLQVVIDAEAAGPILVYMPVTASEWLAHDLNGFIIPDGAGLSLAG